MDPTTPSSSSNQSPAVDTLLNDILSGKPVDDRAVPSVSASPSAPVPSAHDDESNLVASHIHDALEGQSDSQDKVAPGMTPVVKESSLEPTAPAASRLPLGDSEPGVPSGSRPTPTVMPTVPVTPEVSASPVTPLSPVSPVTASAPQTVSNAGGEKFQVAQAPKVGMPKATIAAAIAVIAVVLGGVGAGVALSGQNQDVRNQAYVAPAKTTNTETVAPSEIVVVPSAMNGFLMTKSTFPNARSQAISGGGISGTLYSAQTAEGKTILFAEMSGVAENTPESTATAWVEFDDGTFHAITTLENEEGKAYASYENISDKSIVGFVVSYENSLSLIDVGVSIDPSQKVLDVRL